MSIPDWKVEAAYRVYGPPYGASGCDTPAIHKHRMRAALEAAESATEPKPQIVVTEAMSAAGQGIPLAGKTIRQHNAAVFRAMFEKMPPPVVTDEAIKQASLAVSKRHVGGYSFASVFTVEELRDAITAAIKVMFPGAPEVKKYRRRICGPLGSATIYVEVPDERSGKDRRFPGTDYFAYGKRMGMVGEVPRTSQRRHNLHSKGT